MTLARRFVWKLVVLLISVVSCAVAGDSWQGSNDVHQDGRAMASQAITSAIDLTGRWEGQLAQQRGGGREFADSSAHPGGLITHWGSNDR